MNDGIGIEIITEDDLDAFFNDPPELLSGLIPGVNIKTGCYGLFLIALDQSTDKQQTELLNNAIDSINNLDNHIVFNGLCPFYPPDDLSHEMILKLATVVINLKEMVGDRLPNKIANTEIDAFEAEAIDILGLRSGVVTFIEDLPEDVLTEKLQNLIRDDTEKNNDA